MLPGSDIKSVSEPTVFHVMVAANPAGQARKTSSLATTVEELTTTTRARKLVLLLHFYFHNHRPLRNKDLAFVSVVV